jgi:hypothetical protein
MTPTYSPYAVLYHSSTFRHHLCHPQGALHQDLKLTKMYQVTKVVLIILHRIAASVNHAGFTSSDYNSIFQIIIC